MLLIKLVVGCVNSSTQVFSRARLPQDRDELLVDSVLHKLLVEHLSEHTHEGLEVLVVLTHDGGRRGDEEVQQQLVGLLTLSLVVQQRHVLKPEGENLSSVDSLNLMAKYLSDSCNSVVVSVIE